MLNGEFFPVTGDLATIWAMIEMCAPFTPDGEPHCKFIPDILYIYNYINPLCDEHSNRKAQLEFEHLIRKQKPYQPLEKL